MKIKSNPVAMRLKNRSRLKMDVEFTVRRLTPEAWSVLEQGLRLLCLEHLCDLPGIEHPDMLSYFISGTRDLLVHHGPEYITRYRQLYLD